MDADTLRLLPNSNVNVMFVLPPYSLSLAFCPCGLTVILNLSVGYRILEEHLKE